MTAKEAYEISVMGEYNSILSAIKKQAELGKSWMIVDPILIDTNKQKLLDLGYKIDDQKAVNFFYGGIQEERRFEYVTSMKIYWDIT